MTKVVKDYVMCAAHNTAELDGKVVLLLKKGYELYGSPSVSACERGVLFIQSVVLYDISEED